MTNNGEPKTLLTFIGHASVKITAKDGTVLYIDPSFPEYDYKNNPADIILVTHEHDDHLPNPKLKLKDGGLKFTNREALRKGLYGTAECGSFKIEAVPAANSNHGIDCCVGYIVTVDGISLYHAGDTSKLASMAELKDRNLDYAMFPIDGIYNMDAVEAAECAEIIGAKVNIPMHEFDKEGEPRKSDKFNPEGRLVLEYGETIVLGE